MKKRTRLDQYLLDHGHFPSLREAQASILCGRVLVNGSACTKAGTSVRSSAVVRVRGERSPYASRGGYKLDKALRIFDLDVRDKVVLDAGAAAGGFTDCLLQNGAQHIFAVDVGFGQLKGRLATDPRVTNWERVNISDLSLEDLLPPIDLCTADLSFLSLATAIPVLRGLFTKPYLIIALIKPLFEGLSQEHRSEPRAIGPVLQHFFRRILESRTSVVAVTVSPILGTNNTIEFLMLLSETRRQKSAADLTEEAMRSLLDHPPTSASTANESLDV